MQNLFTMEVLKGNVLDEACPASCCTICGYTLNQELCKSEDEWTYQNQDSRQTP